MKLRTQHRHVIDLIFPIAVFFVFAASSLAVLMLAANLYGKQTVDAEGNDRARISLSYINEKIRQNDSDGGIFVTSIEGQDCLAMQTRLNDVLYTTYIYGHEGMLKELFIRNDVEAHLNDGKPIMELNGFTIEEIADGLFRFTSVDPDGNTQTLISSERSTL